MEKAKKTAKFLKEHGFKTGDLVCVTVRKLQCTDETIRKALIDQGLTL